MPTLLNSCLNSTNSSIRVFWIESVLKKEGVSSSAAPSHTRNNFSNCGGSILEMVHALTPEHLLPALVSFGGRRSLIYVEWVSEAGTYVIERGRRATLCQQV